MAVEEGRLANARRRMLTSRLIAIGNKSALVFCYTSRLRRPVRNQTCSTPYRYQVHTARTQCPSHVAGRELARQLKRCLKRYAQYALHPPWVSRLLANSSHEQGSPCSRRATSPKAATPHIEAAVKHTTLLPLAQRREPLSITTVPQQLNPQNPYRILIAPPSPPAPQLLKPHTSKTLATRPAALDHFARSLCNEDGMRESVARVTVVCPRETDERSLSRIF